MILLEFIMLYGCTDDIDKFLDETDAQCYQVNRIEKDEFAELLRDNLHTTIYKAHKRGEYIYLDLESCNMRFAIDMYDDMYYWKELCDEINERM